MPSLTLRMDVRPELVWWALNLHTKAAVGQSAARSGGFKKIYSPICHRAIPQILIPTLAALLRSPVPQGYSARACKQWRVLALATCNRRFCLFRKLGYDERCGLRLCTAAQLTLPSVVLTRSEQGWSTQLIVQLPLKKARSCPPQRRRARAPAWHADTGVHSNRKRLGRPSPESGQTGYTPP